MTKEEAGLKEIIRLRENEFKRMEMLYESGAASMQEVEESKIALIVADQELAHYYREKPPKTQGVRTMSKMSASQQSQARGMLKTAGCPDDEAEKIVGSETIDLNVLTKIIAWVTKYASTAVTVWSGIMELIAIFAPAATPPQS